MKLEKGILVVLVLAVILCSVASAGNVQSVEHEKDLWPMFRHDPAHTGYSTSTAPETCNVLWNYTTGGYVESSPAVVDSRVYIGSWDHKLYCLDAEIGELIWNYTSGGWVDSSPAVAEGKVYFGSGDHKVYCLDAETGELIWNYKTRFEVWSSPAVVDDRVYIGSWLGRVFCLDAETGDLIWRSQKRIWSGTSSPAVVDGRVYIGSNDNKVYCLDAETGSLIWSYTTGPGLSNATGRPLAWVASSAAVVDGRVYIGSYDGKVYCFGERE